MKLLVFDGNSIINRAFYGIRLLSTKEGLYTNGIFGFINIFNKQLEDEKPDAVAVAFDLKAPTFRHLQFEAYKAHRKGMPEELAAQMPLLKQWLDLSGITRIECEGFEADDIIGTLACCCESAGNECVIVTGDRDALQLVSEKVTVKLAVTKQGRTESIRYTPKEVFDEYGFEPSLIIDYKAICGDASDNIPGVSGIGSKGAAELICTFGGIDNIYANIEDPLIKKGTREKLAAGREMAYTSKELATIKKDTPIGCGLAGLVPRDRDIDGLLSFYNKLELRQFAQKLREAIPAQNAAAAEKPPEAVKINSAFEAAMLSADCFYLDFKGISLCVFDGEKLYLTQDTDEGYTEILKTLLENPAKKYVHDCKTLLNYALKNEIAITNIVFDSFLAGYLLNPSSASYPQTALCSEYLAQEIQDTPEARAFALPALCAALAEKLESEGIWPLFSEVEMPLAFVLADMEAAGMRMDAPLLRQFGKDLEGQIDLLSGQIYELSGFEFNISSPKQLGEVLFEKMGLPVIKKTKTGYGTDAEILEKLRKYHPIAEKIIEYRTLTKLKSTYADGLLKVYDETDGRIHTTFNQTVTQTGRISSTEPNLQNIPVRGEQGREIRRLFIPAEGCVLLDADYSQIELRVLASIAEDPVMAEAFRNGEDIHTVTACQVFGVKPEEVTAELRRRAKAVNFGIVYGISDFSLAEDIGVSRAEAKEYINNYFTHYSAIKEYLDEAVRKAKECGYVTTVFGRRRYLPELKSTNFNIRSFGERAAMNTPIQGAAADIIKIAMVRVHKALLDAGLRSRLIMQVHDELIVEAPFEEANMAAAILKREMEGAAGLSVPMLVEVKQGRSWLDAK